MDNMTNMMPYGITTSGQRHVRLVLPPAAPLDMLPNISLGWGAYDIYNMSGMVDEVSDTDMWGRPITRLAATRKPRKRHFVGSVTAPVNAEVNDLALDRAFSDATLADLEIYQRILDYEAGRTVAHYLRHGTKTWHEIIRESRADMEDMYHSMR